MSAGDNEGVFYNPFISPSSMDLGWHSHGGDSHLLEGPPESPFFDTRITEFTSASTAVFGPVYGFLNIYFGPNRRHLVSGVIHSVTAVPTVEPNNDLVAHWPLNEGTGTTANDRSGNGNHGSLTNGPIWRNNAENIKLLFDGKNDFINLGTLDLTGNALSLAAKVEPHELENCNFRDCRILSKAVGTAEQEHFWMLSTIKVGSKTRLRFRLKTNGSTHTLIASSGDLTNGVPFHVAATYDGQAIRLYKDGEEVGNLPKTGNIDSDNAVKVWIGSNPNIASSRPWQGVISDVRIYKKALTAEEVNAISQ